MDQEPEMLVTRRSKRSTAGNRMEAALAEMNLAELENEVEEDKDFENVHDEEDVFASDFESADEDAEDDAASATAERDAVDEDRRARKVAKSRLEKATAIAHARNKRTFAPEEEDSQPSTPRLKAKSKLQRVLTLDIDEETGQVFEPANKRVSRRKHTVLNTSATVTRLKESQLKRQSIQPKKSKPEFKQYTQAQLIAKALDNEEGNIKQHRDYLKTEEEKRRRARVIRTTVEGPLLRWISKEGEDKVLIPLPPPPPVALSASTPTIPSQTQGSHKPAGQTFIQSPYSFTTASSSTANSKQPTRVTTQFQGFQYYPQPVFPVWPPQTTLPVQQQAYYATSLQTAPAPSQSSPTKLPEDTPTQAPKVDPELSQPPQADKPPDPTPVPAPPTDTSIVVVQTNATDNAGTQGPPSDPPKAPEPEYRIEKVTKNFLVHELGQIKGIPKPSWVQSMTALFGDHVKWDEVKVFAGKGRPLARPKHTCYITGLPANYLDSRTGVHFANSDAYKILSALLEHHYDWNPELGCYVNKSTAPEGNPDGMELET